MRTIIAGSRGIIDQPTIERAIEGSGFEVTPVLSGDARGVDRAGAAWARAQGIRVEIYPADWKRHGKRAGFLRNEVMAQKADALIAIWDGQSRGTKHMIDAAFSAGLKICIVNLAGQRTGSEET